MATYTQLTMNQRITLAHKAISNALADQEILDYLAPLSYDEAKLNEGLALYEETEALHRATFTERGEQVGATADMHEQWNMARGMLRDKIARARLALRGNVGAQATLKLNERRADRQADWIIQARQFYTAALANQPILDALAAWSLTQADLEEGLDAVNAFETARKQRTKESGDAQDATHARNQSLAILDQWVRDFRDMARIALQDRPQLIERLGFMERGSPDQ